MPGARRPGLRALLQRCSYAVEQQVVVAWWVPGVGWDGKLDVGDLRWELDKELNRGGSSMSVQWMDGLPNSAQYGVEGH